MDEVRNIVVIGVDLPAQIVREFLREDGTFAGLNGCPDAGANRVIFDFLAQVIVFGVDRVLVGKRWRDAEETLFEEVGTRGENGVEATICLCIAKPPILLPQERDVGVPLFRRFVFEMRRKSHADVDASVVDVLIADVIVS